MRTFSRIQSSVWTGAWKGGRPWSLKIMLEGVESGVALTRLPHRSERNRALSPFILLLYQDVCRVRTDQHRLMSMSLINSAC